VLGELQLSSFTPHLGDRFVLRPAFPGAHALDLVLVEATALSHGEGRPRTPFSLVFRGPVQPVLEQGIQRLEHLELGNLDLFLVPIARDAQGTRYEAVFT
jgi:hypothetical protein